MKTIILAMLAASAVLAQDAPKTYNGHGYGYFGVGTTDGNNATLAYGAGGEGFLWKGLALGADVGYMHPARLAGAGFGLLSVNPSYHFVNRHNPGRVVPFVTAGYSLGFRNGVANFWNWGGGATVWMTDRLGLRLEVRDVRDHQYRFNTSFRVGLSFR